MYADRMVNMNPSEHHVITYHCVQRPRRRVLPTSDDPMPIKVGIDQGCADQRRQTVFPIIDRGRQTSAPVPTRPLNAVYIRNVNYYIQAQVDISRLKLRGPAEIELGRSSQLKPH
ncbi:hypothetical protein B0H16DRAFT_1456127 [Mycena metata]|uniref:Uncharacterized protein n=1 Tax=Mycena metata TaxID=1033252 RepID=A0AAD7JBK0_9AGAR|nr:hypothetical protein B0H16DRAFT_1456127 [Mycena metata]